MWEKISFINFELTTTSTIVMKIVEINILMKIFVILFIEFHFLFSDSLMLTILNKA